MHLLPLLVACWGGNAYIVEGTVVEVASPTEVVVDHEAIDGLMGAMVMSFEAKDPSVFAELEPGDRITARLMVEDHHYYLVKVRETGKAPVPKAAAGPAPIKPGNPFPATTVAAADGTPIALGQGQDRPTLVTFLYTSCPRPEMCPATVMRLQGLQSQLQAGQARLVAVTIEPDTDTPEVLSQFASNAGADPDLWQFARVEGDTLTALAMHAALNVMDDGGEILHGTRYLVLGADGTLIERYDDNNWPTDRLVQQLLTGEPKPPGGVVGTVYPSPTR